MFQNLLELLNISIIEFIIYFIFSATLALFFTYVTSGLFFKVHANDDEIINEVKPTPIKTILLYLGWLIFIIIMILTTNHMFYSFDKLNSQMSKLNTIIYIGEK